MSLGPLMLLEFTGLPIREHVHWPARMRLLVMGGSVRRHTRQSLSTCRYVTVGGGGFILDILKAEERSN